VLQYPIKEKIKRYDTVMSGRDIGWMNHTAPTGNGHLRASGRAEIGAESARNLRIQSGSNRGSVILC